MAQNMAIRACVCVCSSIDQQIHYICIHTYIYIYVFETHAHDIHICTARRLRLEGWAVLATRT